MKSLKSQENLKKIEAAIDEIRAEVPKNLEEVEKDTFGFLRGCLKIRDLGKDAKEGRGDIQINEALGMLLSDVTEYTIIDYGCGKGRLIEELNTFEDDVLKRITYVGVNHPEEPAEAKAFACEIKFSKKIKSTVFMTTEQFESSNLKGKYIFCINVIHEIPLKELPQRLYHVVKSLEDEGWLYVNDMIQLTEGEPDFVTLDNEDLNLIFDRLTFKRTIRRHETKGKKIPLITLLIQKNETSTITLSFLGELKQRCYDMYFDKSKDVLVRINRLKSPQEATPQQVREFAFLLTLFANIQTQLREVDPKYWSKKVEKLIWNFEIVDEQIALYQEESSPEVFYTGSTSWKALVLNYDVPRFVRYEDQIWSYKQLFDNLTRKEAETSGVFFSLLTGAAGEGKTTLLLRVGYDLSKTEKGREKDFYVLRLRAGHPLDVIQLVDFYRYVQKPIYLLVDVVNAEELIPKLKSATSEFSLEDVPLAILCAARKGEWEIMKGRSSLHVARYKEFLLSELTKKEIEDILARLEEYSLLGKLEQLTHEERINKFFEQKARRQLLVALMEITKGLPFERILVNEYENLQKMKPKAAEAYLVVCFLYQYGKLTPESYLVRFCGYDFIYKRSFLREIINTTPRVIIEEWVRGLGIGFRARHSLIASTIVREVLSEEERTCLILEIIRNVDTSIRGERYITIKLFRGLLSENIRNKALVGKIIREETDKVMTMINSACSEEKIIELLEWSWIFGSTGADFSTNIYCLQNAIEISERNRWAIAPEVFYRCGNELHRYIRAHGENDSKKITIENARKYFQKAYNEGLRLAPFLIEYAGLEISYDYKKAVKLCEENLALCPGNPEASYQYTQFIKILKKSLDTGEFLGFLERAKVNSGNTIVLWALAEMLEQLGEKPKAFKKYECILFIKPDHEGALWKCAYISMELGNQEKSKTASFFRGYISTHKGKDVRAAMARNDLARLLVDMGESYYNEAESFWLEAINIFPQFPWSYIELGNFYKGIRKYEDAVRYLVIGERKANDSNKSEAIEKARIILEEIKRELGDDKFEDILKILLREKL